METLDKSDKEDACNFFLSTLSQVYDPHSEYFSQSELENFQVSMQNKLVGIGALLQMDDGAAKIQGIVVGGPASIRQGSGVPVATGPDCASPKGPPAALLAAQSGNFIVGGRGSRPLRHSATDVEANPNRHAATGTVDSARIFVFCDAR